MVEVLIGWIEEPMLQHWLSEWSWGVDGHDVEDIRGSLMVFSRLLRPCYKHQGVSHMGSRQGYNNSTVFSLTHLVRFRANECLNKIHRVSRSYDNWRSWGRILRWTIEQLSWTISRSKSTLCPPAWRPEWIQKKRVCSQRQAAEIQDDCLPLYLIFLYYLLIADDNRRHRRQIVSGLYFKVRLVQ